jgi:hypothetical protein
VSDVHVEGSSERAENWVVFVVSLYSTISKSMSRASTRRVAVFAEPAGPVRISRRCIYRICHLKRRRNKKMAYAVLRVTFLGKGFL